jgi:dTDP-L-rhamnose 4-epimerase
MSRTVLVTGGAGFVGSHLADELLRCGYRVRALDNLTPQVHGKGQRRPRHLDERVELQVGDVRDPEAVARALEGVEAVFHLAAAVGVGQSMYRVADYTAVNNLGTAVLLEGLLRHPVRRLIVASSMSIYGEGLYRSPRSGRWRAAVPRLRQHMRAGQWEARAEDGEILVPRSTPETKQVFGVAFSARATMGGRTSRAAAPSTR